MWAAGREFSFWHETKIEQKKIKIRWRVLRHDVKLNFNGHKIAPNFLKTLHSKFTFSKFVSPSSTRSSKMRSRSYCSVIVLRSAGVSFEPLSFLLHVLTKQALDRILLQSFVVTINIVCRIVFPTLACLTHMRT